MQRSDILKAVKTACDDCYVEARLFHGDNQSLSPTLATCGSETVMLAPDQYFGAPEVFAPTINGPFQTLVIALIDAGNDYCVEYGVLGYSPVLGKYFSCFVVLDFVLEVETFEEANAALKTMLEDAIASYAGLCLADVVSSAVGDFCAILRNPAATYVDCGIIYPPLLRRSSIQYALTAGQKFLLGTGGKP